MTVRLWIVTFFGAGLSPIMPGTVGSIAAAALLYLLHLAGWSQAAWATLLLAGLLASGAATVALGPWAIERFARKDPQPVVLDEVAGVCLTLLFVPMTTPWITFVVGTLAFRLFDMTKPPPVRSLERLPAGWGILMDDLGAAALANALSQIVLRYFLK